MATRFSSLLLGSSRPVLPITHSNVLRRPLAASAFRTGPSKALGLLRSRVGLCVRAISAPEKPATEEKPFTAWDTAVQRVAKRDDLKTIMILGAGPIIIGQVSDEDQCLALLAPVPCIP